MKKIVVVYSGGMDSFTMLNQLMNQEIFDIHAISFDYGQRHLKELQYASDFCVKYGIDHKIVDMSEIGAQLLGGSSQTDMNIEVPKGHYADETMKLTVVPNRNMIMLSIATGYAVSIGAERVFIGVHSGDHAIYPDCRPSFIRRMNDVTHIANYQPVIIEAPYLNIDKGDIAFLGRQLDLDYNESWTCYEGRDEPCGECGACVERAEAFEQADQRAESYPEDDFPDGEDVEGSE